MSATVLVVDDDDDVRSLVALHLTLTGFGVAESDTVDGALTALAAGPTPDLVLTDLNFGADSGQRLVEHCLAIGQPVILMTASVTARELPSPLRDGVAILHKPFSLAELSAAVSAALASGDAP
jgi:DNA-binding NtrC family response regulator